MKLENISLPINLSMRFINPLKGISIWNIPFSMYKNLSGQNKFNIEELKEHKICTISDGELIESEIEDDLDFASYDCRSLYNESLHYHRSLL